MSFFCLGVLPLYLKAVEVSMEAALQEDAWSKSDVVIAMLLLTPPLGVVASREKRRMGKDEGGGS